MEFAELEFFDVSVLALSGNDAGERKRASASNILAGFAARCVPVIDKLLSLLLVRLGVLRLRGSEFFFWPPCRLSSCTR